MDVLEHLLGADESLDQALSDMGCTYRDPDGSRLWLPAVRDRIRDASREAG